MGTQMKIFMPSPDLAYNSTTFAWWENGFTDEELDAICIMGERASPQSALVGAGVNDEKVRGSTISWLDNEGWLADKLQHIARQLNGKFFGLDLWGFGEQFQYTTYKYVKKSKQHYDWHMDNGPNDNVPRKLSMVLQLSHPSEYEGGNLELMTGNVPQICKKQRGFLCAFPSYIMHRVTPITNGTRRTLVVWISGPRFK
jgi:PKHD-type hydroxylase